VDDFVPLGEGNLERLTKDGGKEKQQRSHDTRTDGGENGFAHEALL
jgi:hypothetical protein